MKDSLSMAYADFLRYVGKWAENLCAMITKIMRKGVKPILIALSRKMPRFIDWVIETKADNTLSRELVDTIGQTELTTELALPYLFFQSEKQEEREYIIVDDIIIHGTTIRNVVKDIVLVEGDKCHLSCIFRLDSVKLIPYIGLFEQAKIHLVSQEEANVYIDIISRIVEDTQLPIDMEFPIMTLFGTQDLRFHALEKELNEIGLPTYRIGTNNNRFSIDLPAPGTIGKNNDFSKIRFFKKKENTVIEVISPYLISNHELLSTSIDDRLFEDNSYYQALWDKCTLSIRRNFQQEKIGYEGDWETLKSNFSRSLCVLANYLFSLSVFSAYRKMIYSVTTLNPFRGVELSQKDLSLLLGIELAAIVYSFLEAIIANFEIVHTRKDSVLNLPNKFSPVAYKNDWERNTIVSCITNSTAEEALKAIFLYQHYSNPVFRNTYMNKERLFFGESYRSLHESIKSYFPNVDYQRCVGRWIDENIDEGYVVPKYEKTTSSDGVVYWRRYFHAGIRLNTDYKN